jgi:hypothetical protein
VLLTAAAPDDPQAAGKATHDPTSWFSKFAAALGINRKSVPYRESITKRAEIDAAASKMDQPIAVGDQVSCKHGIGTLTKYNGKHSPCEVQIMNGDIEHLSAFDHPGKGSGGGRVRHAPISFSHESRKTRKDRITKHTETQVQKHYESHCAVSPCAKDKMRRRVGVMSWITLPMLILLTTMAALYSSFETAHPALFVDDRGLSYAAFKRLRPWNMRKAKHQSCLCQTCENFGCYEKGLAEAMSILTEALEHPADEDDDDDGQDDPITKDPRFLHLKQLTEFDRRYQKAESTLCDNAYYDHKMSCIDNGGPAGDNSIYIMQCPITLIGRQV